MREIEREREREREKERTRYKSISILVIEPDEFNVIFSDFEHKSKMQKY